MAGNSDWEDAHIRIAKLAALVREARTRPLSEEEIAELSVVVDTVIDVEAELKKKRPRMKRVHQRVAATLVRLARDERSEGDR